MLQKLSIAKRSVDALEKSAAKYTVWDDRLTGFGVKVMPSGVKTFLYAYRFPRGRAGKMRFYTIGKMGDMTPDQARDAAERLQGVYKDGKDPMAEEQAKRALAKAEAEVARNAPKRSVASIVTDFVERHAKRNNRSWAETERILKKHVVPAWGERPVYEINRSDVNALLDDVEDSAGAPMATAVLAQVRKMFNWYATRDGKFNSPIVKGMARTNPKKMQRDRVLSDDEIRVLWRALDASAAPYRQLVRFLLLTAQRRDEAAQAHAVEIGTEGGDTAKPLWTIPAERYKTGRSNGVPLSAAALEQIQDLPPAPEIRGRGARASHVFTTTGDKPFSGFSKAKARLDAEMERIMVKEAGRKIKKGQTLLTPWRLHDLRRTAKTLMQRAGVRPDISERVLGHVISGVEGTYDRYAYLPEKRHALNALAVEISRIVSGEASDKVIPFRAAG